MINFTLNHLSRLKIVIVFFTLLVTLNIIDIYDDLLEGSSLSHVIEESIMVLIFISIILVLVRTLIFSQNKLKEIRLELKNINQLHAQQSDDMQRARKDYSQTIRSQFSQWGLTETEQEIGFLLLKGLSLKEIASIRDVKEKSTRQQASNIYSKAGVTGRHEFAGWFFEELSD
ncbi:helix-turn-helix transcriptional regulator [Pleionea litopenaei]|uniref:Helix-turn-helix transcriptional regulator n=1 Tax=Pleionea litopenaei TaxID=3070815 RepID=A0AA51RRY2_9GAMM|nr:helix-turn-helix transcriptional regulator [Pleionea sp. HL-JVS1]WMS86428.1 helix-turn-helix transcriptional regulator [Pleionea sp. HL-JVS1]